MIKDFLPAKLSTASPEILLEFWESHKEERNRFVERLDEMAGEVSRAEDPVVLKQNLLGAQRQIEADLNAYRREVRKLRLGGLIGTRAVLAPTATQALSALGLVPPWGGAIALGGLVLGAIWGLSSTRDRIRSLAESKPMSYLDALEKLRTKEALLQYHDRMHSGFEQFIYD